MGLCRPEKEASRFEEKEVEKMKILAREKEGPVSLENFESQLPNVHRGGRRKGLSVLQMSPMI